MAKLKELEKVVEKTIEKEDVIGIKAEDKDLTEKSVLENAPEKNVEIPLTPKESLDPKSNQKQIEGVLESYNALKNKTESENLIVQYLECIVKEMTREIEVVDEEVVSEEV